MHQNMTKVTCEITEGRAETIVQPNQLRKVVRQKKAELRQKKKSRMCLRGGGEPVKDFNECLMSVFEQIKEQCHKIELEFDI